jgi:cephalosporin hydroxylase
MNTSELFESAIQFYEANNLLEAEAICNEIIEQDSEHWDAICLLGMISHKLTTILPNKAGTLYHLWYYNSRVWHTTSWAGVITLKSPSDMWNYQEIIFTLKPSLIIEFGTCCGGSALFFSSILRQLGQKYKVFSVDISHENLNPLVRQDANIELFLSSSTSPIVAEAITELQKEYPGAIFAILDSDHTKEYVLNDMLLLRPLLKSGDYLIVEDGNINGHPVLPGWGEGPYEALQEYFTRYPDDYHRDYAREDKFGFTFATAGFLIRR